MTRRALPMKAFGSLAGAVLVLSLIAAGRTLFFSGGEGESGPAAPEPSWGNVAGSMLAFLRDDESRAGSASDEDPGARPWADPEPPGDFAPLDGPPAVDAPAVAFGGIDDAGWDDDEENDLWGHGGWGWSSWYSWTAYDDYVWSNSHRSYWKKYWSSKRRKWLIPDSGGKYYVSTPGSFGLYDPGAGGWGWSAETEEDAMAAGEPVTTESAVSMVFLSPAKANATGYPTYLASFDRDTGDEIFNLSLPSGVDKVDITEEEHAITVTTCFGAVAPCEQHTFTL
jgi:hypothetical protein